MPASRSCCADDDQGTRPRARRRLRRRGSRRRSSAAPGRALRRRAGAAGAWSPSRRRRAARRSARSSIVMRPSMTCMAERERMPVESASGRRPPRDPGRGSAAAAPGARRYQLAVQRGQQRPRREALHLAPQQCPRRRPPRARCPRRPQGGSEGQRRGPRATSVRRSDDGCQGHPDPRAQGRRDDAQGRVTDRR